MKFFFLCFAVLITSLTGCQSTKECTTINEYNAAGKIIKSTEVPYNYSEIIDILKNSSDTKVIKSDRQYNYLEIKQVKWYLIIPYIKLCGDSFHDIVIVPAKK